MKIPKRHPWLVGLGVLATLVTACGETTESGYPKNVVDTFVNECMNNADGIDYAREICQCTIDRIQVAYTFDEFKAIDEQVKSGEEPPEEMLDISATCYSQVSEEQTGSAYPPQTIENFMASCTEGDETRQEACQCAIDRMQAQYSFEEFVQLDRQIQGGEEVPAEVTAIMEACLQPGT
ncbi:MAG: hypothetical protein J7641_12395 [Cyanobacteria bacterium SID2]|nr:hypothetical protein [Cyanobacteria bacterium SID2]MBP0003207.1 hypothetical protein [Cyanobacteria bacterium SBC]